MRIAVTGAAGFIGTNLIHRLVGDGEEVLALVRPGSERKGLAGLDAVTVAEADICDAGRLKKVLADYRPDVVFHLASTGWTTPATPREHKQTIIDGTRSLLAAMRGSSPGRLIAAGSGAEYGSGTSFTEDDASRPDTPLGAAKGAALDLVTSYTAETSTRAVWLRLFTPFGPWESPARLTSSVISAALSGKVVALRSPDSERDFIAVADTVEAMVRAMDAPLPRMSVINICRGEAISVIKFANLVSLATGSALVIEAPHLGCGIEPLPRSSGSNMRARDWLGWEPKMSLNDGIRQAIDWWKERIQ